MDDELARQRREEIRSRLLTPPRPRKPSIPKRRKPVVETESPVLSEPIVLSPEQIIIGQAILAYADHIDGAEVRGAKDFDPSEGNFVTEDPFSFLIGVIFDQGIPYEKARKAPAELRRRLGHLDPKQMMMDPEAVRHAINNPSPLHRYTEIMPDNILAAASKVITDYGGDADRIWNDEPTAKDLIERLMTFRGIGLKKAAMATEMLEVDRGVTVREMEGSEIAYDIHVRRVFLRSGLAEHDTESHMVAVARAVHPARPVALDDPAWRIGKFFCHATNPECESCPITDVCPKMIDKGRVYAG